MDARTFEEYELPIVAAGEKVEETAVGGKKKGDASFALAKCCRIEGTSFFVALSFPLIPSNF